MVPPVMVSTSLDAMPVVVLAGNGQCAAAVDGQVVFREDRRAGFVGFGVGEGIGRAVRQRVLGAVGQGQDGLAAFFA